MLPPHNTEEVKLLKDCFLSSRYDDLIAYARKVGGRRFPADELVSYLANQIYGATSASEAARNGGEELMEWSKRTIWVSTHTTKNGFSEEQKSVAAPRKVPKRWKAPVEMIEMMETVEEPTVEDDIDRDLRHSMETYWEMRWREEGMSPGNVQLMARVQAFVNSLPPWLVRLWDMYRLKGMSIRRIEAQVGIPRASVFLQLKELEAKLEVWMKTNNKKLF